MADLQTMINHLKEEVAMKEEEVVIFIAPPLCEKNYLRDKNEIYLSYGKLVNKPKEFIVNQGYIANWNIYDQDIVAPINDILNYLKNNSKITIIYEANYKDFVEKVEDEKYKYAFLIAHHITKKNKNYVEFSDGGVEVNTVIKMLENMNRTIPISLIFMICDSIGISQQIYGHPNIFSVGAANRKVSFIDCIQFLKLIILSINEKDPYSLIYRNATRMYIRKID